MLHLNHPDVCKCFENRNKGYQNGTRRYQSDLFDLQNKCTAIIICRFVFTNAYHLCYTHLFGDGYCELLWYAILNAYGGSLSRSKLLFTAVSFFCHSLIFREQNRLCFKLKFFNSKRFILVDF